MRYFLPLLLLLTGLLSAQVPQSINYQAVLRDDAGTPLASATVDVDVNITDGANGPLVYAERWTGATTDAFGLLNLAIGAGANQGIPFSAIDWSDHTAYLDLIIRIGEDRLRLPATPLRSVPYAVIAERLADPLWERGGSNSAALIGNRVGIGTAVPREELTIAGPDDLSIGLRSATNGELALRLIRGTAGDNLQDYHLVSRAGNLDFEAVGAGMADQPLRLLRLHQNGRVGIGQIASPRRDLHIRNAGEVGLRVTSLDTQSGLDLYVGGADDYRMINATGRLRLQRSTDGGDSFSDIFDVQTDGVFRFRQDVNMADQRIVNVADPEGGQHVVNRRYLEDYVGEQLAEQSLFPAALSSEAQNMTFDGCANRCRTLTEGGFSDWGVPSLDQLSQFAGGIVGDPDMLWTSTGVHTRSAYAYQINSGVFQDPPTVRSQTFTGRFIMRLNTGDTDVAERNNNSVNCRCVR